MSTNLRLQNVAPFGGAASHMCVSVDMFFLMPFTHVDRCPMYSGQRHVFADAVVASAGDDQKAESIAVPSPELVRAANRTTRTTLSFLRWC